MVKVGLLSAVRLEAFRRRALLGALSLAGILVPVGQSTALTDAPMPDAVLAYRPVPLQDVEHVRTLIKADRERRETAQLCGLLTAAAASRSVPRDFFIRLIFKESRFNSRAVSPVGAQGIAQFMPGTARLRGLKNPFDPEEALFASAAFLADLEAEFGSWGLAAAGYNGGPNRVPRFVAGESGLPRETIDYVYSITGRTAQYWAQRARWRLKGVRSAAAERLHDFVHERRIGAAPAPDAVSAASLAPLSGVRAQAEPAEPAWRRLGDLAPISPHSGVALAASTETSPAPYPPTPRPDYVAPAPDCPMLVARLGQGRSVTPPEAGPGGGYTAWGAQVAGHPRRDVAMRQYARLKGKLPKDLVDIGPRLVVRRFAARGRLPIHAVQFAAPDQSSATALCRRIAASRAPCVVVKNS